MDKKQSSDQEQNVLTQKKVLSFMESCLDDNKLFNQDQEAKHNLEGMLFSIGQGDSVEDTIHRNQGAAFHLYLKSLDKFKNELGDFESVALGKPVYKK